MQPKPSVRGLPVYKPGKPIEDVKRELGLEEVIKLASNENPFGCSPRILDDLVPDAMQMGLYPDGAIRELKERVARDLGLSPDHLIFGNGSDEVLQHMTRCFVEPGMNTVMADVTFPRYETNVRIEGADVIKVPLVNGTHDLNAMAAAVNEQTKIVWVCNPNNPTGTIVHHDAVKQLLDRLPSSVLVVLDEAYYDSLALLAAYPNVMILRTFSKIYGLASLRVGYGIAAPEIIKELNRVREPFNVNTFAQKAALRAWEDQAFVRECHEKNAQGIQQLTAAFDNMGLDYFPPQGNFIFVKTGVPAEEVFTSLLHEGVIVRADESWGYPTAIRVTVGSEQENARFLQALKACLQKRGQLSVS